MSFLCKKSIGQRELVLSRFEFYLRKLFVSKSIFIVKGYFYRSCEVGKERLFGSFFLCEDIFYKKIFYFLNVIENINNYSREQIYNSKIQVEN